MRLISKTTLLYLLLAFIVFSLGGVISLEQFKKAVSQETDYELMGAYFRTKEEVKKGNVDAIVTSKYLEIMPLESNFQYDTTQAFTLRDTNIYLKRTEQIETFRKLIGFVSHGDQHYRVEIIDIFFEDADLKSVVNNITMRLFLFLTIGLIIGSILISKFIFRPFEQILQAIEGFRLSSDEPFKMPPTNTREFQQLNRFLERMTTKARMDYVALKEFSENASHEIQTPIAIAKGKLELLQESSDLQENQLRLIQSAQHSLTKLSKLGQALSLITKIENQEFISANPINLSQIVAHSTQNFSELATLKNIAVEKKIQENVQIKIDPTLADILISNLLKNAVQHNIEGGRIQVQLTSNQLVVENTGKELNQEPEKLFERFQKNQQSSKTLGLGLAIVKKICDLNHMQIHYHYKDRIHSMKVDF